MMGKVLKNFLFLILFLTLRYIVTNREEFILIGDNECISIEEVDMDKTDSFITSESESDNETIKEYFANGMNVNSVKEILEKKPEYVSKNGQYEPIVYNFDYKLHYSDIENMLFNMNNLNIVSLEILNDTVDGRNIYGIEIGKGNKVIYIDANIHAGEVGNTVIIMKFLSELLNSYNSGDREIISKLSNIKLAIIPTINPDGYEIYNFGKEAINNKELWIYKNFEKLNINFLKSNANGVDLNRNFPTQNGGLYFKDKRLLKSVSLTKTTKRGTYFCGEELGSENETKASIYFMLKHYKNTYAYLDMHSQGRVIFNGKPNLSNEFNELSRSFANYLSSYNKYKVYGLSAEEVGEGNDGTITDFMAELAHGFKFSTKTGRLSTSSYIENNNTLMYNYPVVTMESLTQYTRDVKSFEKEYYDLKIRDILYDMLDANFIN